MADAAAADAAAVADAVEVVAKAHAEAEAPEALRDDHKVAVEADQAARKDRDDPVAVRAQARNHQATTSLRLPVEAAAHQRAAEDLEEQSKARARTNRNVRHRRPASDAQIKTNNPVMPPCVGR